MKGGETMADYWQWKGNLDLGAGYLTFVKGSPVIVVSANITAELTGDTTYTSAETSILDFNSILLETQMTTGGRTAKVVIDGAMSSGGTLTSIIDKDTSAQMTVTATASKTVKFMGLPDYLGISMTLSAGMTAGSSVSVKILPLNL